jgi:hypothetical protein
MTGAEAMLLPREVGKIGHPVLSERTYALHAKKAGFWGKKRNFPGDFRRPFLTIRDILGLENFHRH